MGNSGFNMIVMVLFLLFTLSLFGAYSLKDQTIKFSLRLSWLRNPLTQFVTVFVFLTSGYLLLHEFAFRDGGRSIKYIVYLFFFLGLLSTKVSFEGIKKFFASACVLTSIAMVIQAILIATLYDNDLSRFENLPPEMVDGRTDGYFYNPFWLGIMNSSGLVDYNWIRFFRTSALTTEPKYCSKVLWIGLLCALSAKTWNSRQKAIIFSIICVGLFASHSYASLAIILLGLLFRALGKSKHYVRNTVLAFLFFVVALYWFSTRQFALSGFIGNRVSSYLVSVINPLYNLSLSSMTLFGMGFEEFRPSERVSILILNLRRFGWIGSFLHLSAVVLLTAVCVRSIRLSKSWLEDSFYALSAGVILIHFEIFNPEFITPLYSFFFAMLLSEYLQKTRRERPLSKSA